MISARPPTRLKCLFYILKGVYLHCKIIEGIKCKNLKVDYGVFSKSENAIGEIKIDARADLVIKFERFNMLFLKVVVIQDKECKNCHIQPPAPVGAHNAEKELTSIIENQPNNIERLSNNPANIYLFKVNNINARRRCEICSKLTIKRP